MTAWLLCAGSLGDPGANPPDAPSQTATAAISRTPLRRGALCGVSADESIVPAELPDEAFLRERFGLHASLAPATFAVHALGAPLSARAGAIVVRPVHLHVGLDHLVLLPPQATGLSRHAAESLADAANAHFPAREMRLRVLTPDLWLLESDPPLRIESHGTAVAAGRNVADFLPTGADARVLRARLSELQMLWHVHPSNLEREAHGKLTINSLWLEGIAPAAGAPENGPRPTAVFADSAALRGLAHAHGVARIEQSPSTPRALADAISRPGAIVELPCWRDAMIERDRNAWVQGWRQLPELVAPALRRVPARARLRVVLTGERLRAEIEWRATDRFRWWRRTDLALEREWHLRTPAAMHEPKADHAQRTIA